MGELRTQLALHVLRVEALEGAVARLLEQDENRHDLAGMQGGGAPTPPTCRHLLLFPDRLELLPERIHRAVQVEYTHEQYLQTGTGGLETTASYPCCRH